MAIRLEQVVPWGRSMAEYIGMFAMTDGDLSRRILGVGDGPASFNAEWTGRGGRVVSVDPLYAFEAGSIRRRVEETFGTILAEVRKNMDLFVWDAIPSPDELGRIRMGAMERFCGDLVTQRGRYVAAALPELPLANDAFDLALCSHLLFLYSDQLSADLHVAGVREMVRVAGEARIYPLVDLAGEASRHVPVVREAMEGEGCRVEVLRVPYRFQKLGGHMMVVRRY